MGIFIGLVVTFLFLSNIFALIVERRVYSALMRKRRDKPGFYLEEIYKDKPSWWIKCKEEEELRGALFESICLLRFRRDMPLLLASIGLSINWFTVLGQDVYSGAWLPWLIVISLIVLYLYGCYKKGKDQGQLAFEEWCKQYVVHHTGDKTEQENMK